MDDWAVLRINVRDQELLANLHAQRRSSALSPILYYAMGTPPVLVGGSSGALFGLIGFIIATPHRGVILANPINIIAIIFLLSPLAFAFGIAYLGHLLGFVIGIILGYVYVRKH